MLEQRVRQDCDTLRSRWARGICRESAGKRRSYKQQYLGDCKCSGKGLQRAAHPPSPVSAQKSIQMCFLSARCSYVKPSPSLQYTCKVSLRDMSASVSVQVSNQGAFIAPMALLWWLYEGLTGPCVWVMPTGKHADTWEGGCHHRGAQRQSQPGTAGSLMSGLRSHMLTADA